ncbi:MAG: hypothetical protein ACRD3E_07340 [Terriglobales bacterium]
MATIGTRAGILLLCIASCLAAAQTDCYAGSGPLRTEVNVPDERAMIEKFTARESRAAAARRTYSFAEEISIQTLVDMPRGGTAIDGQFRQALDVSYDDKGNRIEHVTFAPQNSLRRISIMPSDVEDFREFTSFMLTSEELPQYQVRYLGAQHVDDLDTYVFEVAPAKMEKNKRYFQGKLWVEQQGLDVVKTCGRSVPDQVLNKKKGSADVHPLFATYRQQMGDGYWFPTYSRSDDYLLFPRSSVHVREIVKFRNFQPNSKPAGGTWQTFDKKK